MKSAAAAATLLLLLAVTTAAGEEGDAPLSDSKKELQRLQSEPGDQGAPVAKDGLKANVPLLQLPATSGTVYERPAQQQRERDRQAQKNARKNWLIDGMARLENGTTTKALLPGEDAIDPVEEGDGAGIDPSDPAYLLKLYDRQKKAEDAKSAETKTQGTARPDAFAPFLQDWMAASPVKDQLLANLRPGGGAATSTGSLAVGAPGNSRSGAVVLDSSRDPVPAVTPNPYLSDSNSAGPNQPGGLSLMPAATGDTQLKPLDAPAITPQPGPALQPAPVPGQADRKAPPPPLADDKKYFPQLNRF